MGTESITIRSARLDDAAVICAIYNQGIEDGDATLETRLRSAEEQREWLASRDERQPVLVADREGSIVGWGSLNAFNPRAAYDHVSDFSVYVARASRGAGIGRELIEKLVETARDIGYHKMVLAAFEWNALVYQDALDVYKQAG